MSIESIHLHAELRARLACAAEREGKTTQSFILEAITEKLEREEMSAGFDKNADRRFANIVASGKTIAWVEMRRYLEERVAGREAASPLATMKRRRSSDIASTESSKGQKC